MRLRSRHGQTRRRATLGNAKDDGYGNRVPLASKRTHPALKSVVYSVNLGCILAIAGCLTSQGTESRDAVSTSEEATDDSGDAADGGSAGPTTTGPRTPWAMGTRYIMSGHSLTDTVISNPWPGRLVNAVTLDPAGAFENVAKATIPGSFIHWRWTHRELEGDQSAQWPEEMAQYQGLVITTAVPLYADDAVRQQDQVDWLKRAVEDAWQNGNGGRGAPTLLYSTWTQLSADPNEPHPEDNLPFRTRLNRDQQRWEAMQDFVNRSVPSGQVPLYLIPGHRLMMRIYDDIEAGTSPFANITDVFMDSIHPNSIGAYAFTILHYACIYGRDPAAFLPDRLEDSGAVTPTQAQYFKRIVAEVVTSYSRTGLTTLAAQ